MRLYNNIISSLHRYTLASLAGRSRGMGLLIIAAALVMTSCFKDQEDYFDKSPSKRLQQTLEDVQQLLRSAEYGWEFEYYPHGELAYGGIVYLVKFDSLEASVSCSLIPDSTATSYYRMTNDNGPVLTFDTYNPLLHYFSTPSASEYEAKGGEFEFVVNDISDDLITLYGKKTHNTMYLRRLTSSPDDYAERTVAIYDNFIKGFAGSAEGNFDVLLRKLTLRDSDNPVAFAFTNRGIHLYHPIRINGVEVQSFEFDSETRQLKALDEGTEDIILQGERQPTDIMRFSEYASRYLLRYDKGSSTATVELVPNRLEGNYRLRGLSPMYELLLNYDDETGVLTLGPQIVGDIDGNSVYFATYGSGIWIGENSSFTIKWNGNRFYPTFNFEPTFPDRYDCESALLITLAETATGYAAAIVDKSEWATNGSCIFLNIVSLSKLRN
ncbi:MAG: DUF4302 domain-containing protein [Bacteroidaceae bacterium]|nr:DUF4302 domain-containing protein [Bacteroidaceae bacterium]